LTGAGEDNEYATVMVSPALDRSNDACLRLPVSWSSGSVPARLEWPRRIQSAAIFHSGRTGQEVLDQGRAALKNRIAEVEAQFRAAMQNRATAVEWRCAEDFSDEICRPASARSRYHCRGRGWSRRARGSLHVGQIQAIFSCRREGHCLLFPMASIGSICEAFWSPGKTRLNVGEPLPMRCRFCAKPKIVIIAGIVEDEADRASVSSGTEDIVAWLLRHGVVACERVPAECGDATAQLDRIASELERAWSLRAPMAIRDFASGSSAA